MPPSQTPNLGLEKPDLIDPAAIGVINTNMDTIDAVVGQSVVVRNVTHGPYNAVGDGVADDTAAIQAALNAANTAGGGVVYLPPGTYLTRSKLGMAGSNVVLAGAGTSSVVKLVPSGSIIVGFNDRAVVVEGSYSARRRMAAGAIAAGALTFTANSAGDTADLVPGDWVVVSEYDGGLEEIVVVDWVQVRSVLGAVVTTQEPIRTAFPDLRAWSAVAPLSGLGFQKVTGLAQDNAVRDLKVLVPPSASNVVGVQCGMALNTLFADVVVDAAGVSGGATAAPGFYCYRSKGLTLRGCRTLSDGVELASVVDLVVEGCHFGHVGTANNALVQSRTSIVTFDYGCAYFSVVGCRFVGGANIAVQVLYCHDGSFVGNTFGYVRAGSIAVGNGMTAVGCTGITVADNTFVGGAGASVGLSFNTSTLLTVDVTSVRNRALFNNIAGFSTPYGAMEAGDTYLFFHATTGQLSSRTTGTLVDFDAPYVEARRTTAQSIANGTGTNTLLTFNSNMRGNEADALHSETVDTGRFKAPVDGRYAGHLAVVWAGNAAGYRDVFVHRNGSGGGGGSTTKIVAADDRLSVGAGVMGQVVPFDVHLLAGDYIEFRVNQNSGGALDVAFLDEYSPVVKFARVG